MHKCYNYTKIKKGEPNLEKLKNCLDKWGHYRFCFFSNILYSPDDLLKLAARKRKKDYKGKQDNEYLFHRFPLLIRS